MPVAHLRVCAPCGDQIRYAPCSLACRVSADTDPDSWLPNMQEGAGTLPRGEVL